MKTRLDGNRLIFNVGGVMRFQDQRSVAHLPNPVGGELGRFEETPRPLDAGDRGGHPVRDGELGLEGGFTVLPAFLDVIWAGQDGIMTRRGAERARVDQRGPDGRCMKIHR